MTTWFKCSGCGYTLQTESPPDECPSCRQKCLFVDCTCYTPDCGGPENIDPKITGK